MKYSDKSTEFFFLTPSIPLKFGGLTTALFRRADFFTKHFNNNVTVLTFNYDPNIDYIKKNLESKGYTNDKVKLNNLYEYFSYISTSKRVENPLLMFSGIEKIKLNEYKSEEYDLIIMKNDKEKKHFIKIECYNDKVLQKVYELNENGNLKRVRSFDKGYLVGELFYRNNQTVYLEKTFCGTEKSKTLEILLFEKNGDLTRSFRTHRSLQKYWISELLDEQKNNFMIVDGRAMDALVLDYNEKKTMKIFVIHSTHLREPFGTFSTLRLGNRTLLANIGQADNIVFLTNGQKNDIVKRFGDRPNYKVIPHFLERDKKMNNGKVKNRFVVISRFHEEKQLDHIIKAFSLVRDAGLDFTLNIFGDGATKTQLETLIDELGLQKKVVIKNFTSDPFHEFEISEGSILTSRYEGFGLTVLESLISSCPVFSYDIKYGPSDMVESGYNGFLVEKNNFNELAEKLISYIKLPKDEKQLFMNNAVESAKNFNEESFGVKWEEALGSAVHNSNHRYKIAKRENIECKLEYAGFGDGKLKVQISVCSVTKGYKTLEKDVKDIRLEINGECIEMDIKKRLSNNDVLIYECFIPLELLKNRMDMKREISIHYYINLDNVIYKEELKTFADLNQNRDIMQSYSMNIYQLIRKSNDVVKLRKQKLAGLKGILRYIKYF